MNFSFDADVALVVLQKPVILVANLRQTIGLARSSEELTGSGIVVRWGKSERSGAIGNDYDYAPNKIELPIMSQTECFEASKDPHATTSKRTFCAGFINQTKTACVSDSGSIFYQYNRFNRCYELTGIVSASVKDPFLFCQTELYSLITNVAKFSSWIDQQMEETKEIKWKYIDFCKKDLELSYDQNFIGPITRNLKIRHRFNPYESKLYINFGKSFHIFAGIREIFPSLRKLLIINQKIKYIDASDFNGLNYLEKLNLGRNQIEYLSSNSVWDLPVLKILDLSDNKIKEIPESFFTFSYQLEVLHLENNKISHLPARLFDTTPELKRFYTLGNPLKTIDINFGDLPNVKFYKNSISDYFKANIEYKSSLSYYDGEESYAFGGERFYVNDWPSLVALINIKDNQFFCGGSLISVKHVLSAAHCFQDKFQTKKTPSQYIRAFVGIHNLQIQDEPGSSGHEVWDVILHPDWDQNTFSFDGDAAIVVLRNPVCLNNNRVKIVGLSHSKSELTGSGIVVGWGKSEKSEAIGNDYDNEPNKIELPIVSQSKCFEASKDLEATASNRTFCAGYVDQSKAICVGDSGSGFYRFDEATKRYELAGIVSASVNDPFRLCEIELYSLFTNVAKFSSWIDQQMEETKEIKWKYIDFYCNLHIRSNRHTCIHNFNGPMTRNLKIRHQLAPNVLKLFLNFGESLHIFAGISENFPSLTELSIINQKIKYFDVIDFNGLNHLEKLYLGGNQIEHLSKHVDLYLPVLKVLDFSDNKIKEIPESFFTFSYQLEILHLENNKISHLPARLFYKTLNLKEFHAWGNPLNTIDINFGNLPNVKFYKNSSSDYFKADIKYVSNIYFSL